MKAARCRSCGAAITWLRTERLKPIPLDWEQVEGGNIEVEGGTAKVVPPEAGVKRFVSHFVTCPQRREWRRG